MALLKSFRPDMICLLNTGGVSRTTDETCLHLRGSTEPTKSLRECVGYYINFDSQHDSVPQFFPVPVSGVLYEFRG